MNLYIARPEHKFWISRIYWHKMSDLCFCIFCHDLRLYAAAVGALNPLDYANNLASWAKTKLFDSLYNILKTLCVSLQRLANSSFLFSQIILFISHWIRVRRRLHPAALLQQLDCNYVSV